MHLMSVIKRFNQILCIMRLFHYLWLLHFGIPFQHLRNSLSHLAESDSQNQVVDSRSPYLLLPHSPGTGTGLGPASHRHSLPP